MVNSDSFSSGEAESSRGGGGRGSRRESSFMTLGREGGLDSTSLGSFFPFLFSEEWRPNSSDCVGVLSGAVGGSFGPFPRSSTYIPSGNSPFPHRDSLASSEVFSTPQSNRYSTASMETYFPIGSHEKLTPPDQSLLWDKSRPEEDDYLHNPDPEIERRLDREWRGGSLRGWLNGGLLGVIVTVLVGLFAGFVALPLSLPPSLS